MPDASSWVRLNNYVGDFLSVWSRRVIDWHLWKSFYLSWNEPDGRTAVGDIKLMPLDPPIPRTPLLLSSWRYRTFMKSDHAAFWHHKNRGYQHSLNAVLLTDMGATSFPRNRPSSESPVNHFQTRLDTRILI